MPRCDPGRPSQGKESEYPFMNPTQKVAVVTGASQGIGAALVTAYRKLGYVVVANSRSITASEDPDILTVPGDLAEPGAGARVAEQALARFGRIDTLINNAGTFIAKPFTEYTDEDYDAITGVNLRASSISPAAPWLPCSLVTAAAT
jgi:NAD(P)-dependent dehydrogenase (short-subunit alcohol dehydrogenase family)